MFQFLFICICTMHQISALSKNPSVIIVGAGTAGIAAAAKLLENSITNITILEAENRIGGRIHSVKFGDGYVDLGAEYCDGEKGNAVYEAVKDLDLLERPRLISPETNKLYYSNGCQVERQLALDLNLAILQYDKDLTQTSGISIGEAFLEKYNSTTLKKYSNDKEKLKICKEAIKLAHDIIIMFRGSFYWEQPSAGKHLEGCEGDQLMTWKTRGFHVLLDVLMKRYPNLNEKLPMDDKLFFNKTVKKITWNSDQAKVETSDNTTLIADYVILTPSIGVLKEQKDVLFVPELPQRKQEAIESIGFNGVMKIILHFPNIWWKDDDKFFLFLWSEEDLKKINTEFPAGPKKDDIPWVSQIVGLIKVPGNPNALIAWLNGDIVPKVEEISEELLLQGSMYVIRKFLDKDYNITDADKIVRSNWITNPNFRGTYSYDRVEYFREDDCYRAQLSEPLLNEKGNPVVLFSGEATHPTMYGCVHGAIEAGRREAERVINLHKK